MAVATKKSAKAKKPVAKKAAKPTAKSTKAAKAAKPAKEKGGSHPGIKPDELTTAQLAKQEGVLIVTVRAWINSKKIKARQLENGRFVIPKATFKRPISQVEATKAYYAGLKKAEKKPAAKKSSKKKPTPVEQKA